MATLPYVRYIFVFAIFIGMAAHASDAYACWLHHRCRCGGSRGLSAPAAPAAAPAAAMVAAPASIAYTVSVPAYTFVQAPAAAAPQQGIVSEISTAIEIIKLLKGGITDIRGGSGGGSGGETQDLSAIEASLKRLEEGQKDLKGRLINNAGIGQSIGAAVVGIDTKLGTINTRLDSIDKKLGISDSATEPDDDLEGKLDSLEDEFEEEKKWRAKFEKKFDELEEKLEPLTKSGGALDRLNKLNEEGGAFDKLDELNKKGGVLDKLLNPPAGAPAKKVESLPKPKELPKKK